MGELTTVEGTVHSVIFQNAENGYTVLRLLTEEGEVVTVVGCIPGAAPGEGMAVSGAWESHPQHGEQFHADEVERRLPEGKRNLFAFLASGVCKGIGPATAKRLVDKWGDRALEVLENESDALRQLPGLTEKRARELSEAFRQTMGLRRLVEFLSQYELPPVLAVRLRERYGDAALAAVRENPYLLSSDSLGVPFAVTDEIAMSMGFPLDSLQRHQAAVCFELSWNEHSGGHVFLPRPKLLDATARLLGCGTEQPEKALDTLIAMGEVVSEPVGNVEACYLRRLWEAEASACKRMLLLLSAAADKGDQADRVIGEIEEAQGVTYAERQREAVRLAAQEGVVILTGGPGTGKTTTVRGIVALFRRMGLTVSLCAPTGRAAKRLSELTGLEAQTVHRLLGMMWNKAEDQAAFGKTEKDPLEAEAVVVDEASMVDLPLFAALLRALRPGTRLLLVGDADQLPSVGAGNVFSDLIRSGLTPTVYLREVFRQAEQSAIIRNAHAVNLGQPPRLKNDQGDFYFLCRRDPMRALETIVELCASRLPGKMGVPPESIQVLTPTRKGLCGTASLNARLQAALNPPGQGKKELRWGDRLFREGDRIMQTRNDYDVVWKRQDGAVGTGVFNGDVGRIAEIDPSGEWLALDFDGRAAAYSREMLNEVELAYAMTVHKAQGSEYPCVVFAAAPAARSLMVRGVLYTALTRARELLILVGDDAAVYEMAANDRQTKRYSGLRWRLAHSGDAETRSDDSSTDTRSGGGGSVDGHSGGGSAENPAKDN